MPQNKSSFFARFAARVECMIMTRLVPKENTGLLFKWFFKIPILFYKAGLPLFGDFILLLTTTGRNTGKPRYTPLEYRREEESGEMVIVAGWGGKTDWARNIEKNPNVHVQAGWNHFDARAEQLSDEEVAVWLYDAVRVNPSSLQIWSRWAGETLDGSMEGLMRAAKFFPSFRLKKINVKENL